MEIQGGTAKATGKICKDKEQAEISRLFQGKQVTSVRAQIPWDSYGSHVDLFSSLPLIWLKPHWRVMV